jgi:hypothetical protein
MAYYPDRDRGRVADQKSGEEKIMKFRHLFWAIILISIGVLFLLGNLDIIDFSWFSFWRLWPLILIFWGIAILPLRDVYKFTLLILVIIASFALFNKLDRTRPWYFNFHRHFDDEDFKLWDSDKDKGKTYNYKDQDLVVPYDSLVSKGILNLDAAAGNFSISGTTNDFLSFSKKGDIGNYELTSSDSKNVKTVSLKMSEGSIRHNVKKNTVDISLNPKPSWNLNLDIGAAKMEMDLSDYRIDTADFNAGASSIEIKLGDKNPVTVVSFDAGASSIKVRVPKTSGCRVSSESFMVSREFEGLDKISDNVYQSAGFNTSKSKIYITVQTAISSIRVERY